MKKEDSQGVRSCENLVATLTTQQVASAIVRFPFGLQTRE
jgi:hypothetical protein